MNREKVKEHLNRMSPEDLKKPLIMRMAKGEKDHNVVTGEELLKTLGGETLSFGTPTRNPGGVVSKDKLLEKLNKIL